MTETEQPEAPAKNRAEITAVNLPSARDRADELVGQWGERLGYFAAVAGQQLRKAAALAKEGLEDIHAEAQSLRHREEEADGASIAAIVSPQDPSVAETLSQSK